MIHCKRRYIAKERNAVTGGGGGLSDYVVVPRDYILPLPDNVSLETGGTD